MRKALGMVGMAAMAMLAACTPQESARPEPAPVAPSDADACGASKVSSFIGAPRNDEVLAKIKSASGAQTVRVVGPDDIVTQDFRPDRLTITTDASGRIKTLRCV